MTVQIKNKQTIGFIKSDVADAAGALTSRVMPDRSFLASFDDGTGVGQCDVVYEEIQTLTNASFTWTLSALPDGQAMGHARWIFVGMLSPLGTTGSATFGPGATHGWTNGVGGPAPLTPGMSKHEGVWPDGVGILVDPGVNDQVTLTVVGTLSVLFLTAGTTV